MTKRSNLNELRSEAVLLQEWMMNHAFPLWADAGMHSTGVSWEALDFSGEPVPRSTVRVRVQARQLSVFSLAYRLGWQPDVCVKLVNSLFDVLVASCRRTDGLFGKLYNLESGELVDDTFSLYDTAFALLGFATARDLLGARTTDAVINSVLNALEQHVAHQNSGYLEEVPAPNDRLQNPHMHLFESVLALRDAGYTEGVADLLQSLGDFISTQFFDRRLNIVHERRPGDLSQEVTFEPGHSLEWVWLLAWRARGDGTSVDPMLPGLYHKALTSLDCRGYACMEASVNGARTDPSCRLWAQAEALKAHTSMAITATDFEQQTHVDSATNICQGIRRNWLEPAIAGGWYDHLDQYGRLIAADMPASTGYHLFGAIDVLLKSLQHIEQEQLNQS